MRPASASQGPRPGWRGEEVTPGVKGDTGKQVGMEPSLPSTRASSDGPRRRTSGRSGVTAGPPRAGRGLDRAGLPCSHVTTETPQPNRPRAHREGTRRYARFNSRETECGQSLFSYI